ncbi:alpha/beta hydrolase [Streptomyces sp. NBC_01320]|uniref:alpha/beta hydrolase n=1 Tax=Streptomyces sp. NBC_01320 TaxID=2903824 RepID=UPI002E141A88|nr:alpha/beta hydrolase [Streptomyces sp. NBC_01320]
MPGPAGAGSRIEWKPCEVDASAECGALSVPVDWGKPDGERFDLQLARRRATGPGTRVGSMVFGPGGPGDSGVDRIVGTGKMGRFSDDLRSRFDIVSFDPRGVGLSNPIRCSQELLDRRPSPVMKSRAEFDATAKYNRDLREDCRKNTENGLIDHVDTLSMVKDLDAIRAALDEKSLTFHGSSYGTLLGELYAEQYPKRVRALVLEAVVDHSLGTREFLSTQAATLQDSFDEFVAWCGRTESCALHGSDVRARWADLLDRAEQGKLSDNGTALTQFDLNVMVMKRLYGPEWTRLGKYLRGLEESNPEATRVAGTSEGRPEPALGANPFEIFCQDWSLPVRGYQGYARELRRVGRIAPDMKYPRALMSVSACLGAPEPDNPQHRLKVRNSRPLLLTNSVHDPASGYNWATHVAEQLGSSAVLHTYEGWGHGTYSTSPCAQEMIDAYLISLKVPTPGASCPAVEPTG